MQKRIGQLTQKELKQRIERLVDTRNENKGKASEHEFRPAINRMLRVYRNRLKKLQLRKG